MPKVKEPLTDKKIKSEIKKGANTITDGSVPGLLPCIKQNQGMCGGLDIHTVKKEVTMLLANILL